MYDVGRASEIFSHFSHPLALGAGDRDRPGCNPPAACFFFLLSEIISYMYLGFRAETRVNGALYALQRAFQVPATSATGRRLPVPANKIAHIAAHTTVFFLFLNLRRYVKTCIYIIAQ